MSARVLEFTTEADALKCLRYVHARGLGDLESFLAIYPEHAADVTPAPGIPGYTATQWAELAECKHHTLQRWAIPLNDPRVDQLIASQPHVRTELLAMFPGLEFTAVENTFWRVETPIGG